MTFLTTLAFAVITLLLEQSNAANTPMLPFACFAAPIHTDYSYCLSLPTNYTEPTPVPFPTIVFLSGSGAVGDLGEAPALATYSGVGTSHLPSIPKSNHKKGYVLNQTLSGNISAAGTLIKNDFISIFPIVCTFWIKVVYRPYSLDRLQRVLSISIRLQSRIFSSTFQKIGQLTEIEFI